MLLKFSIIILVCNDNINNVLVFLEACLSRQLISSVLTTGLLLGGRTSSASKEDKKRSVGEVIVDVISIVVDSISSRRHAGRHVTDVVHSIHNNTSIIIIIITGPRHSQSTDPAAATFAGAS